MAWLWILLGTFVAGVGSVWIAALLALRVVSHQVQSLLSLAAGALLATAFTHLLPEAVESGTSPDHLFGVLLGGIVFFFLLEKAQIYHHGHDHGDHDHSPGGHAEGPVHHHPGEATRHDGRHPHAHHVVAPGRGGWPLILGDSVHTFCDGVIIAAAWAADPRLAFATVLAVLAHGVPHHIGDFIVLRSSGFSSARTLAWTSATGAITIVGGIAGHLFIGPQNPWLPYLLIMAASSFIYVALADLIPQLQQHVPRRQATLQVIWLAIGMGSMIAILGWLHRH